MSKQAKQIIDMRNALRDLLQVLESQETQDIAVLTGRSSCQILSRMIEAARCIDDDIDMLESSLN